MGRSYTINCLGYGPVDKGRRQVFYAMNRLEIEQQRHKAKEEGVEIQYWIAQTKTGERILGYPAWGSQLDRNVPHVKTVVCPVCLGQGGNGKYYCPVCNGSGITTPGNDKHWQPWQIEGMKKEREANLKREERIT